MGVMDTFRRWGGMLSQQAGSDGKGQAAAPQQSRRRVLASGDRAALWTEEPETCERCGRRLLTGELPALMQRDDLSLLVCPVCAMDLAAAGFRTPPPPDGTRDGRRLQRDAA